MTGKPEPVAETGAERERLRPISRPEAVALLRRQLEEVEANRLSQRVAEADEAEALGGADDLQPVLAQRERELKTALTEVHRLRAQVAAVRTLTDGLAANARLMSPTETIPVPSAGDDAGTFNAGVASGLDHAVRRILAALDATGDDGGTS